MESLRLSFRVASSRRDELIAELWVLGTSGVLESDSDEGLLTAYFDPAGGFSPHAHDATWRRCGAELLEVEAVAAEDWLAGYRARSQPLEIGPLIIDPREPDLESSLPGPEVLRIPARNAFGTGSHESTRLILEALCDLEVQGRSVLDVGTGSGILALAALRRGARRATAFDIDVGSVVTAGDNARLNRLDPALFAGTIDAVRGSFDLVLVNILPHRWLGWGDGVVARLARGGGLMVSGLLATEEEEVSGRLEALGLEPGERRRAAEWSALSFRAAS